MSPATPFSLTVVPVVVYPPASQTVCKGASLSLTMPVVANNSAYGWYKNGTSLLNLVAGTQVPANALRLSNVQTTASYYCKVTVGASTTTYGPYQVVVDPGCVARLVSADAEGAVELSVVVAPNPVVGGRLRATVSGAGGQALTVSAYSIKGLLIHQQTFESAEEQQAIDWDMSQRPGTERGPGIYLLRAAFGARPPTPDRKPLLSSINNPIVSLPIRLLRPLFFRLPVHLLLIFIHHP